MAMKLRNRLLASAAAMALTAMTAVFPKPAHAQISDDVVKIGVLTDMSSIYADGSGMGSVVAAQLAVEDFGGKVNGKPIEVIFADHQNKPEVGLNIARRWYDTEKVDVIADVPVSSIALGIQNLTREKNRVFLMSASGSTELTGAACSPNGVQWTYNTYALSHVAGEAMVARGDDTWFFISADYTFGHTLERDAAEVVKARGGKVLGGVRHPMNSSDFSSFLLQAQASKAKVVAFANSGQDAQIAAKQAAEFGLTKGGQKLIGLLFTVSDARAVGLDVSQGMLLTDGFYWDRDDESRAWSKRFMDKVGRMPTMVQAGVYSAVSHYLKAIEKAKSDDGKLVVDTMRTFPVNDVFTKNGRVREDGVMVHDMYVMQVKTPAESKSDWDVLKFVATVKGDDAFQPLDKSNCPLVKKTSN